MEVDSGLMDWSPGGIAQDLRTAPLRSYYRDIDMPGGFPFTPSRPATPVFERVRSASTDNAVFTASKRLCTTAARAASAISATASTSMISIMRKFRALQRLSFRPKRAHLPDTRRVVKPAVSDGDVLEGTPSQSLRSTEKVVSKDPQTPPPQRTIEPVTAFQPKVTLALPFPVLRPTNTVRVSSLQKPPTTSLARQDVTKVVAFSDDSDSNSSFDERWMPPAPTRPIKPSSASLPSSVQHTEDWYHDGIRWVEHADGSRSPSKYSTSKSRAELLEEEQVNFRQKRRSILRAKIALGDTSKFDIKPLSQKWEAKVDDALRNGHGCLQARDFQKIVPLSSKAGIDAWLNDESINGYLNLITKHANKSVKGKGTPRMHAFSTFFYTSLKSGGYQKVARWGKRANITGSTLLDVEMIFIPINPNQNHWTLAVIQPRIRRITHYNSLGGGNKAYLDVICGWLKGELGAGFKKDEWELNHSADSPQQTNGSDCGVFTVTTAKQLMLGLDPMAYGAKDIPMQRRRMVAELVHGDLLQDGN